MLIFNIICNSCTCLLLFLTDCMSNDLCISLVPLMCNYVSGIVIYMFTNSNHSWFFCISAHIGCWLFVMFCNIKSTVNGKSLSMRDAGFFLLAPF